ncbi:MAG: HAD-IIIA family hydrolase, partial [Nitrospirae bacterium]|nr:HAD-IIIA family hydrolase [Nitrospirota bacterium]
DVDGVMTDGRIILDNEGNEFKAFNVRDGHGVKMLVREGVKVAIVTGRESKVVERRALELGISDVFQRCLRKLKTYEELKDKYLLTDNEIAFIGDDIVDLPLLIRVGLSVAVSDSVEEVKERVMLITKNPGGSGAVREVCELLLKAKGVWNRIIEDYNKV